MKKTLAFLLSLGLTVSMLAGCGSKTNETTAATDAQTESAAVRPWLCGFHIFVADAIVSNQRIGHHNGLSCIRWISQHLQISGHGCVKYDLADDFFCRSDTFSSENSTVLQNQICFHSSSPFAFNPMVIVSLSVPRTLKKGT